MGKVWHSACSTTAEKLFCLISLVSKISIFQDVWMQKGLITVLDYNNFHVILINNYASDILMAY